MGGKRSKEKAGKNKKTKEVYFEKLNSVSRDRHHGDHGARPARAAEHGQKNKKRRVRAAQRLREFLVRINYASWSCPSSDTGSAT